ncbi:phosphatidate phosphatase LPIN2-like isoform X2 [Conger conger]|uniref:phosphatidate phosphatase LPIN2-like isoform X2 n=1 Tax=Conger conger TaxID=82655 RepID=UPI002A5AA9DD|nr:phosphatidate phosphatase LPIN2-like isoform X2 [Conger conger]
MMERPAGFKPVASAPEMQRSADLRSVPEMERVARLRKVSSLSEVGTRTADPRSAAARPPGSSTEEDSSGPDDSSSVKSSWSLADTMTYVGQLAGQVLGTVKQLYKGINQATLSGCIDVVVVRQPDGTFHCSPFHVRFGKLGILRSREKVVDIEVNGVPVDLHMKLGANGEAFFVEETEQENIFPAYLATSPIPSEDQLSWIQDWKRAVSGAESQNQDQSPARMGEGAEPDRPSSAEDVDVGRKRRTRRKRRRRVGGDDHEAPPTDEEEEEEEEEEEVPRVQGEEMFEMDMSSDNEEEEEELSSREEASLPMMLDTECRCSLPFPDWVSDRPTHSLNDDVELEAEPDESSLWAESYLQWTWDELPEGTTAVEQSGPLDAVTLLPSEDRHFQVILSSDAMETGSAPPCAIVKPKAQVPRVPRPPPAPSVPPPAPPIPALSPAPGQAEPEPQTPPSCTESTATGSVGVVTPMLKPWLESARWNSSPQSVGSADSGAECDLPDVTLSLCGGLTENTHLSTERFMKHLITYQEFAKNPALIDNPDLVVRIADRYYSWALAAPLILSLGVFQQTLPEKTEEAWVKEKTSKKSSGWWFWRKSVSEDQSKLPEPQAGPAHSQKSPALQIKMGAETSSDEDSERGGAAAGSEHVQTEAAGHAHAYKKSLRLSSDQIARLNLREGPNSVTYSITSQYQGTCRSAGTIYLWNWDDKVIISDIDGTITRWASILTTVRRLWADPSSAWQRLDPQGHRPAIPLHRAEQVQVPVLLGSGHWDGGHDAAVPALGEGRRGHLTPGPPHPVSQQPLLRLPQGGDREEARDLQDRVSDRHQEPLPAEHAALLRGVREPTQRRLRLQAGGSARLPDLHRQPQGRTHTGAEPGKQVIVQSAE